ncbi:MAG TPA: hypothetical protein VIL05_07440 [Thermoclostridium sp.]
MKLTGRIFKGTTVLMEEESVLTGEGKFQKQLELSLVELCKKMGISVPMWLGKNTREFSRFKWTTFNGDQFFEPVNFDRFEIRLEDI